MAGCLAKMETRLAVSATLSTRLGDGSQPLHRFRSSDGGSRRNLRPSQPGRQLGELSQSTTKCSDAALQLNGLTTKALNSKQAFSNPAFRLRRSTGEALLPITIFLRHSCRQAQYKRHRQLLPRNPVLFQPSFADR